MIKLLVISRTKYYSYFFNNPLILLTSILLAIISIVYGISVGVVLNKLITVEVDIISDEAIKKILLLTIIIITVVRTFIPEYRPIKQIYPRYFPLSKIQIYIASLIIEFTSPFFVFFYLSIASCAFTVSNQSVFIIHCVLVLINTSLFLRNVQYLVDFQLSKKMKVFSILLLLFFLGFNIVYKDFENSIFLFLVYFLVLFITGYMQEISINNNKILQFSGSSSSNTIFLKLLVNNRKARLALTVGVLFKIIFLLLDLLLYIKKGKHLFDEHIILLLFASPLFLFTYVLNNVWGFWKKLWLNMELRIGTYPFMIKVGIRLIVIPLIVEAIITLPILVYMWDKKYVIFIFYFVSSLYLITSSFFWSIITSRKIEKTFQPQGSTSPISIFATIILIGIITFINSNSISYFILPFILLSGIGLLKYSVNTYKNKKYSVVEKIFGC